MVATLAPPRLITAEELLAMGPDFHYELIRGELRLTAMPTGRPHGRITSLLNFYFQQHILENDLGELAAAETGFILSRNPDTVKAPDVAFVAKDRLPPEDDGYYPIAPDLVVETRSPSDRSGEVRTKMEEWLAAGVQIALSLDPAKKQIIVYRPNEEPFLLTVADTFDGGDVLPGFTLPLAKLFPAP